MGILRFTASADTTITNAYKSSLSDSGRATGSNMGAADVLEIFSIYSQSSGSSSELSRALLKFPISEVSSSRVNKTIPASGSVDFYLRMFNAKHAFTTPSNYNLQIVPVTQSWEEGHGLDMEEYKDKTKDGVGANWINATSTTKWYGGNDKATATMSIVDPPGFVADQTFILEDAVGNSQQFIIKTDVTTRDGSVDGNGNIIWGVSDMTAINVVFVQKFVNFVLELSALDLLHIGVPTSNIDGDDTLTMNLQQQKAGADGNSIFDTSLVTGITSTNFTGGTSRVGGSFDREPAYSVSFANGDEDLEVNITELVEKWIAGRDASPSVESRPNYGIGVFLSSNYEAYHSSSALVHDTIGGWLKPGSVKPPVDGNLLHNLTGSKRSYYTKKFFSRTSEYFFKRPMIEARWNSSIKDNRANFYASSSLADETDNMNTIYLYNMVRGQYKNIPTVGDGQIYVRLFSDKTSETSAYLTGLKQKTGTKTSEAVNDFITGGLCPNKTGIYSASFATDTALDTIYDRWYAQVNATATITIADSPTENNEITIIDAYTTSRTYIAKTDASTSDLHFDLDGTPTAVAASLQTAIESTNGHNGTVTVTSPSAGVLILTQKKDGIAGNTTITNNVTNLSINGGTAASNGAFTSGRDINSSVTCFHTGTINVKSLTSGDYNPNPSYVTTITNMKPKYSQDETARFRVYVRDKNWSPNSYTKYTTNISSSIIDDAYYKVVRIQDNLTAVNYGTGSANHTLLSYDTNGNYFDFNMSVLEKDYSYGIKFVYKRDNIYHEQSEIFKFRVE